MVLTCFFYYQLTHTVLTRAFLTRSLTVPFVLKCVKNFLAFSTLFNARDISSAVMDKITLYIIHGTNYAAAQR